MQNNFSPRLRRVYVLLVLSVLSFRPVAAQPQELRRILYGTSTSISHLPVWVGKDTGLFAKNGLNIEPVQIRGGVISTMAIMSGQSVLSGVGAGSVVAARVEGGDIVLLACPADLEPVYLIARPEIKSPLELKGKAAGVTRLNSSIHFYLRSALRMVSIDSDKEMTLLQLGGSPEIVAALESGRIVAAALTIKDVFPFMQRNWPVFADLSKSDLVYPSSCVTSTRAFVKADPKTVNAFLNAYVTAIQLIKKDPKLAERSLIKWLKEKESATLTKSLEAFIRLFKSVPYAPDKGIENILKDLANQRPVPKELIGHPELFRDNGPLERALPK
jgi:NitT/TauT family transport system substrate-binding protein